MCNPISSAPVRVSPPAHLAHWQGLFTGGGAGWEEGEHTRAHTYTAAAAAVHARRDLESVYNLPLCVCVWIEERDTRSGGETWLCSSSHPGDEPAGVCPGSGRSSVQLGAISCCFFPCLLLNSKHTLPARSGVLCESCKALASPSVEALRTNLCTHPLKRRPHSGATATFHLGHVAARLSHIQCSPAATLYDRWRTRVRFFFVCFLQGKDTYATHATSTESAANGSKKNSQQPKLRVAVEFLFCTQ